MRDGIARGLANLIAASLLTISACSCAHATDSGTNMEAPKNLDELRSAVAATLKRYNIPGCGIALVTKDKVVWTGGVGVADLSTGRAVDGRTLFRIGSITKTFTAIAIMQLSEHGKLRLDDKVGMLAPDIPVSNPWDDTDPVLLAHVMEFTAGFGDMSPPEVYDFNPDGRYSLREALQRFPGPFRVQWRPGTAFSYSNPGYGLLGYIIEARGERPYEDFVTENIIRPLGMTHSGFTLTAENKNRLAVGYAKNPPQQVPYHPILLRPAGQIISSPNDMARYLRMLLNRGELDGVRIAGEKSIERMETPQTSLAARAGLKLGGGAGMGYHLANDLPVYEFDGGLDGFLSAAAYVPRYGFGFFFAINRASLFGASDRGFREIHDLLLNYLAQGLVQPGPPEPQPIPGDISRWAGFYEPKLLYSPLSSLTAPLIELTGGVLVRVRDGSVYQRPLLAHELPLTPIGGHLFCTKTSPEGTTAFSNTASGRPVMIAAFPPVLNIPLYFETASAPWAIARIGVLTLSTLIMLTSALFALVWIPRAVLTGAVDYSHLEVRLLPLIAVLALLAFGHAS